IAPTSVFFNDTATTEIYTFPTRRSSDLCTVSSGNQVSLPYTLTAFSPAYTRSEEHTSELQSLTNLACRLLLEKNICTRLMPSAAAMESSCARSEEHPSAL